MDYYTYNESCLKRFMRELKDMGISSDLYTKIAGLPVFIILIPFGLVMAILIDVVVTWRKILS